MKLIKKIKALFALKEKLKGCIICYEYDKSGKEICCPSISVRNIDKKDFFKALNTAWELFYGDDYIEENVGASQCHYLMVKKLPHSKWLLKSVLAHEARWYS